jgi:GNAT superfamily N-acetyltransferase
MFIEEFQPQYMRPLVELWRKSFEHGVGITDPHPLEDQLAYFETTVLTANAVRIALLGSELVGFLASTPQTVECLYVAVPHIGRGIGSRLLALAKSESSGSLGLFTFAQNRNARAFYERHGFVDTGHGFENMWKLEDVKYVWSRVQGAA